MPELPEVQTIRSQLSAYLPMKIEKVYKSKLLSPGILHTPLKLTGLTIPDIGRIGKLLIFKLDNETELLSHLGMTGGWIISKTRIKGTHTHLTLEVSTPLGPYFLHYDDPRRFGHLYQMNLKDSLHYKKRLGVDIASKELTLDYVTEMVQRFPKRHLKVHLLDQKYFAGSGNYIASELCAHAGIRPDRRCMSLSEKELKKLHKAFETVLSPAIKNKGVTFQGGYRDADGNKGFGVSGLVVFYQKTCQRCKKTPVTKIILGARGTYYCSNCQK